MAIAMQQYIDARGEGVEERGRKARGSFEYSSLAASRHKVSYRPFSSGP